MDNVKKTIFEDLDTVNKRTIEETDKLLKLNALFNPYFAFSDTQLIDNAGFRQAFFQSPSSFTKCLFEDDPATGALGPTIEVCYRPAGKENGKIEFRKVVENMIARSKEPMLFSSLNPTTNNKLRKMRDENERKKKIITYDDFLEILKHTEQSEAKIFDSYVDWLNDLFNEDRQHSKKEWSFKTYSELVERAILTKEGIEKTYPIFKTPSASKFHDWLKEKLSMKPDRTPLRKELQARYEAHEIVKEDKELYEELIDYSYNYNLAVSHDYAFTQKTRMPLLNTLFYEAGLRGSKLLEKYKADSIEKFKKKFEKPERLNIRKIDFNKITYEDIQKIRTSQQFRDLLIDNFLKNEDPIEGYMALEDYCKFLSSELPKAKIIGTGIPNMVVGTATILSGINPPNIAIISGGFVIVITGLFERLDRSSQTDRDVGRTKCE